MRRLWVIGLAALAVSGISGVAAAKPLDKGTFHDESSEVVEDFCDVGGLTAQVDNVFDVRFSANTKGNDQLVYFAQHIDISNVYTNVDTGAFVTESIRFVDKDLKVTDNGDGTLSVLILSTGNATISGEDGKAIGRNPGQVRFLLVVDHGDTPADPSDDTEISFDQVKGSTGRSDDFCEVVVPALT